MNRTQKRVAAKRERQAASGPAAAEPLHQQGLVAYRAGRLAEAAELIGRAIGLDGRNADYCCNLGVIQRAAGKAEAALIQFERAVALEPRHALALGNMGNTLAQLGRLAEAAARYRAALALMPQNPAIENNLGNVLRQSGAAEDAIASYERAIALVPDYAEALGNLGSLLVSLGRTDAAIVHLERALALRPADAAAHANLGSALCHRREYRRAEAQYRAAVEVAPNFAVAHSGLGDVLWHLGLPEAAVESYRQALRLRPDDPATLSALLFLRNYASDTPPAEMTALARAYGEMVCRGVVLADRHPNLPDPERRVRVGLVSGDLRAHAVSRFLSDVLTPLRGERLELFAYPTSVLRDQISADLAGMVDHWRDVARLDDDALCAAIRADGIDILVDLSGHTQFNRLPAFACRPAPVQVTWLGYSGTTGLGAIDYILGDRWVTPESEAAHLAETAWRLPASYLCFAPPALPVAVGPLPAGAQGPLTFGCFNNLSKLSQLTIAAWARILHSVPDSRLLLKHQALADSVVAAETLARFTAEGVEAGRVALKGRDPTPEAHLQSYNLIDIALDPFPYNGTTTTVEAMWMGVPVLAIAGDRFIAHVGESILNTVGLGDWVAADIDTYVARAAAFAADRHGLAALRRTLRQQVLASPLCDAPRFARDLEAAFRGMWRVWCARQRPHL